MIFDDCDYIHLLLNRLKHRNSLVLHCSRLERVAATVLKCLRFGKINKTRIKHCRELKTKCLQKCYRRAIILWFFMTTSYCRNHTSEKYAKYVITHIRMIVCPCAQIRTGQILLIIILWCEVNRRSRGQFQGVPNS